MNDASHYLSRLTTEIKTPQQRLKNLKVLGKLTSDLANRHVSYEVAKFVSDQIDALDTSAEQQGVEDPIASALEIPLRRRKNGQKTQTSRHGNKVTA